ncbi:MAG TPA: response regulator [Candidatus Dormibacteraeota bacterium]|nr:response regulator [Candidatus Dormibacteraeota bacterium]
MGPLSKTDAARILVVEDDASLRRLLEMRLTIDGYTARTAEDGIEALAVLEEWTPDLVVADVMMPRLSGLSLCRAIRDSQRLAAIPVILLTARNFDDEIEAVVRLGGITFMSKPFDAEALRSALRAALGDHAVTSARRAPERIR